MFTRIDTEISKCRNRLNLLRIEANLLLPTPLIISTGDISDVDGFYALAKYAQSGADVLFIMNYPAYLNPTNYNVCEELELGLGFRYNTAAYLKTCNNELNNLPDQGKKLEKYKSLMNISNLSNPDTQCFLPASPIPYVLGIMTVLLACCQFFIVASRVCGGNT